MSWIGSCQLMNLLQDFFIQLDGIDQFIVDKVKSVLHRVKQDVHVIAQ